MFAVGPPPPIRKTVVSEEDMKAFWSYAVRERQIRKMPTAFGKFLSLCNTRTLIIKTRGPAIRVARPLKIPGFLLLALAMTVLTLWGAGSLLLEMSKTAKIMDAQYNNKPVHSEPQKTSLLEDKRIWYRLRMARSAEDQSVPKSSPQMRVVVHHNTHLA